jgi:LacI family transcriptional regulator
MEPNRLGNWEKSERDALARRLRRTVRASPGYEEKLWEELLRRLEQSLSPLTTTQAAQIMGAEGSLNCDDIVNQTASHLRRKIREASKSFTPDPHVYLSQQTYAIQVAEDPPPGWKQAIGPSIGLLLADASDSFVGSLISGVIEVCERHAYDLVVDASGDNPFVEMTKLTRLLERTHGVLIVPVSNTALNLDVKKMLRDHDCVLIDRYIRELVDIPCVHPDDVSAGRQAAIYLKECRCSRVLIVDQASRFNTFAITPLEDRVRGCRIELQNRVDMRHLPPAGSDEEGGFAALENFDKAHGLSATDGIFALTDRLAVGCKHYLARREPPLDLPIIGTEGKSFGDFMSPPLTSIVFDDVQMGRTAAAVLFALLQEEAPPSSDCAPHYLIPPALLKPEASSGKRKRHPISFPDAASYYEDLKKR